MDEPSAPIRVMCLSTIVRTAPPFVGRREELAPSDVPFAAALCARSEDLPEDVEPSRGHDAQVTGRLLHRVEVYPPTLSLTTSAEVDQDKLQRFFAAPRVTLTLAQGRLTLFAADDLYWADRSRLNGCTYLVFSVAEMAMWTPAPRFLIGAYRLLVILLIAGKFSSQKGELL